MGGTSTDVALIDADLRATNEADVAGLPVRVPMLDIHTVGAGGGSIARFDAGGALRVGPESAGADPGPICYGRGEQPTVTDANLLLGRLRPEAFLGGEFPLDLDRTRLMVANWLRAQKSDLSVEDFSAGVVRVVNATMEKAIRVVSVERGYDPRDFTLVAFGGAGGLHACELAAATGHSPRDYSCLSWRALGLWHSCERCDQGLLTHRSENSVYAERIEARKIAQSARHLARRRIRCNEKTGADRLCFWKAGQESCTLRQVPTCATTARDSNSMSPGRRIFPRSSPRSTRADTAMQNNRVILRLSLCDCMQQSNRRCRPCVPEMKRPLAGRRARQYGSTTNL